MGDVSAVSGGMPILSLPFFALATAAIVLFRTVNHTALRAGILVLCNLAFLATYLNAWYPAVLLGTLIVITYGLGELHARLDERMPAWFAGGITAGLWATLFLIRDPELFSSLNPFARWPVRIVGISYLMFRAINYVLDAVILEKRSIVAYANYMLFFPTLLAGPIERFDRFQLELDTAKDRVRNEDPLPAAHRICNGIIKKYVIADNLPFMGSFVAPDGSPLAVPLLWMAVMSQLILLYLDFSGYCDIVIGVARLMGLRIQENFNQPWKATSVQDFWTRWHISLTQFVQDYVFTPMQRLVQRHLGKQWQFGVSLGVYLITMLLIALWHDVTWGFFVFGCLHGCALVVYQLTRRFLYPRFDQARLEAVRAHPAVVFVGRAATYAFVSMTLVFWPAGVSGTLEIFRRLVGA